MSTRFDDRLALITGAGSGLGRACAFELARRGASLVLADINPESVERTAQRLRTLGCRAQAIEADIADEAQIAALARQAGEVDILVNNAGVACAGRLDATDDDDWRWLMGINLWGPIQLTRAILPGMLERRRGHIVNIASIAGLIGVPSMTAYSTSKFGLVGFSEALRFETLGSGVDVTVVCPGYIRTGLDAATRYRGDSPVQSLLRRAPRWYGVSAAAASATIVDAIARRDHEVIIGIERLGCWLKRISPLTFNTIMRGLVWASSGNHR